MQKIVSSFVFGLLSVALLLSSAQISFASSSIFGTTGSNPNSIAVDSAGNIYTANLLSNNVTKITPGGVSTILGVTDSLPVSIAVDSAGNVYTSNIGSNNVTKITPGGVSTILGTTGTNPQDIAVDSAGNVYTENRISENVTKITPGGVSTILGTTGTNPQDIAVDSAGNVYTANYGSNNVTKITPGGVSTILGTTGANPNAIAVDSAGNVYTSNIGSNNITKITPGGSSVNYLIAGGNPQDIAVDSSGNVYTANGSNSIAKMTLVADPNTIGVTSSTPGSIVVDSAGNIYTAHPASNNVYKTIDPLHDATVSSGTYTISNLGGGSETITDVPFGTSKADFLANIEENQAGQTWNDTNISDPVLTGDTLVVTAEDGTTIITYTITVLLEPSHDATVTSNVYTIGTDGGSNRTITNVPFGVSQDDFLDNLTKGNIEQSWDSSGLNDPVVTGDTLVVEAEDGTTVITYTITTLADPGVDIDTCAEFENIENALYRTYRLTTDLDCTSEGNNIMVADNGSPFTGTLDGQNHAITVAINYDSGNMGLFGQASRATISNLNIAGFVRSRSSDNIGALVGYGTDLSISDVSSSATVSGLSSNVGGLIGYLDTDVGNSTIENSSVSGNVSGLYYSVGGLIGRVSALSNITITNSHSSGSVDVAYYAGGLIGYIENNGGAIVNISGSYSTSTVIAYEQSAGGLVGYIYNYGSGTSEDTTAVNISNSYHTTGNVSQVGGGGSSVGGLIGDVFTDNTASFNLSDSYAEGNVSGNTPGGIIGYLSLGNGGGGNSNISILRSHFSGNVSSNTNYNGGLIGRLDTSNLDSNYAVSNIVISNNYTTGTVSGVDYLGGLVGYGYVQNAGDYGLNLTLNNNYSTSSITSSSGTRSGGLIGDLRLINNAEQPFTFTFNQNYSTGNISVNGSYVGGLVGYLYSSDEYDDQISSTLSGDYYSGDITVDLEDSSYVGGIIGYAEIIGENQLEISSSYSTSDVAGVGNVGGLLGSAQKVDITGSYATGDVSNSEDYTGGLVGYFVGSGTIDNSFASGNITGAGYVGGLVGYNNGTINTSYASGTVNGSGSYIGGLVGYSQNLANSYATGNVTGGEYVGSLVGYINNNVSNSYAVGTVTSGGENVGGLIGFDDDGHSYSYYLNATSGTDEGHGIPRTSAEMKIQTTFQPGEGNWNFDDIWGIDTTLVKNSGYPYLQWELYPGTPVASPVAGTYSAVQTISFTATGSSSIRYSTISIPADCSSGTLYSTPISVSTSQTLFVRACNSIGNSSIKDFSYTISTPVSRGGGGGSSTPSNVITPLTNNIPIVCKTGEIFSTVTGQRCTSWGTVAKKIYQFGNVTLKLGSKGEAVKELQRFLNDTLNLGLAIDGKLGPKTITVIKKWQKEHGLVPDGLVGKKTKDMMNGKI